MGRKGKSGFLLQLRVLPGRMAIGLGGCAIAAVDPGAANSLFGLDGEEESIFYAMPVGRVRSEDQAEEDAFYAFVREQNL